MPDQLTADQSSALEVARALAVEGLPLFLADPDPAGVGHNGTGFWLPSGWQHSEPDPAVVEQWRPGMALCAVMGHGLDLVDVDPRNGGETGALNGSTPTTHAVALTPSGGSHLYIASLGVGSRDGILPGIDLKGGRPDGKSRGFAFLPPTVRPSKVTGEPVAYRWATPPARGWRAAVGSDMSGAALAATVRELLAGTVSVTRPSGPAWWQSFVAAREPQSTTSANAAIAAKLAEVAKWTPQAGEDFRRVLLRAALTLGGYVGGGYLDGTHAWAQLEAAAGAVWGAADERDRLWIQQGLDDGAASPFHVYVEEPQYNQETQEIVEAVLTADGDPDGLFVHQASNEVDSLLWVLAELGLRRLTGVFRRGHQLVYCASVGEDGYLAAPELVDDNGPATVRAVNGRALQTRIALNYLVWRWAGGKRDPHRVKVLMPMPVCEAALTAVEDAPHLRMLRGVTHTPMVRADGTVLDIPGFDAATGYLYLPDIVVPPVPAEPTAEETANAATFLRGLFSEFSWAGEHDEANYLGVLLTPLLRELCPPPYKLAAIMARQPGSGKSLLARVMRDVHGGVFRSEMPADDAEMGKSLTSILTQTTAPVVQFDNVTGVLRSSRLAGLLTSAVYSDRVLGSTNNVDMPNDRLWTITGNNLALGGDLVRRTLWITIDPKVPNPEERTGFRIPDLPAYVREHRGSILHALLVLVRAWVSAGSPIEQRSSDDYGRWSAVVRGILRVAGVPGEFDHTESRQQTLGTGDDDWGEFLEAIRTVFGDRAWTAKELLSKVHDGRDAFTAGLADVYSAEHPIPFEALPSELADKAARSRTGPAGVSKSLGMWLRNREGRWAGGLTVRKAGEEARTKVLLWRIEGADGDPGRGGPVPPADTPPEPIQPAPRAGSAGSAGSVSAVPMRETQSRSCLSLGRDREETPQTPQTPRTDVRAVPVPTTDAARRADEAKISKAEARRQLAEEARQAAVAAAQGEVLELPAVVDRAGNALPVTVEQALALVRAAIGRAGGRLDVDVETSGYPIGHPDYELRSVQLGDEVAAVVLHPVEHAEAIRTLLAEASTLGAFSATADLVPIAHAGLGDHDEMWSRMHDVVIAAKLADPRSTGAGADGLKGLAAGVLRDAAVAPAADEARASLFSVGRWLKETKVTTPIEKNGWAQVETGSAVMLRYAASDVLDTAACGRVLPRPEQTVYERERLAQRMTARIAYTGVRLDGEKVAELTGPALTGRAEAATRVQAFGVDKPGSDKQIGEALLALGADLPRSKRTGAPSVAKGVIEPLRGEEGPVGDLVRAVLDYRHHDTLLGTFLEPYRLICEQGDGRARPTIYTVGTNTGRMSAVRPNLQQLPRQGGVRACLTADPGQLMIGADFSGVEIRVAAALSQDPTLLSFLRDGRDLHTEIAKMVWGEAAAKAERYRVKPMVFGRLYGGGVDTLAAQGGVRRELAQQVIDALDALTPGLAAWSASIRQAAQRGHTQFRSYSGRVIHLPQDRPHAAPNYCIQGSARELLVDALVRWRDTRWGSAVLLPVHDELDVFVPAEDAQAATAELVRCMETTLHGVAIVADPSEPSPFWQDSV